MRFVKKHSIESFQLLDVDVIVSLELIVKAHIQEESVLGAVKLHISKNDAFDAEQSKYVATCIYKYLDLIYFNEGIRVLPELCLCVDIYAGTIISSSSYIEKTINEINTICSDIKKRWSNV